MSTIRLLRKRIFSISPDEATFARRGFQPASPEVQSQLETAGKTFLEGYRLALEAHNQETLEHNLNQVDRELGGFAFEGAAMALALFDLLTPWRHNRFDRFLKGAGAAHAYMVHVGLGWAVARIPWARRNVERRIADLDPLLRWLVLDGYGFHQGYFHWRVHVRRQAIVHRLSPYARRAFDQGLGRSLWFVNGANVSRISKSIGSFADERKSDLWSGLGLACAYAGGVERATIEALRDAVDGFLPHVAQGAAFAAKARQRAGNETGHTDLACQILCDMPAAAAAAMTDECLEDLGSEDGQPAYEVWRRRIQERLVASGSQSVDRLLQNQESTP